MSWSNEQRFRLLGIVYFVLLTISGIEYYMRSNPYIRPPLYFAVLSMLAGVVFLQIMWSNRFSKVGVGLILFEILMVSLSFTLTQQALYQTVLSRDPWTHGALISQILIHGHIPEYIQIKTPYVYLPLFHLLILDFMLIGDVGYKWALYWLMGVGTMVLLFLVVYLLSKRVFEEIHLPLLAVLLVGIADNVLDMAGKNIVPNSIGAALAMAILYLLLKRDVKFMNYAVMYLLVIALAFLHTISYAIMVILTVLYILMEGLAFRGSSKKWELLITLLIVAFFVWGVWSGVYFRSFALLVISLLKGVSPGKYVSSLSVPVFDVIVARAGMIIYFMTAVLGGVWIALKRPKDTLAVFAVASSFLLWGFGIFAFLNPGWAGIAHRFWYSGEIMGSLLVAWVILLVVSSQGRINHGVPRGRIVALFLALTLFSYLMTVSNISNDDAPLVRDYSTRTGWYDSEIAAGTFVLAHDHEMPIASDWDYITSLNSLAWTRISELPYNPPKLSSVGWVIPAEFPRNFDEILNGGGYYFVMREELMTKRAFWLGSWRTMKLYPPLEDTTWLERIRVGRAVVYSSGTTKIIL